MTRVGGHQYRGTQLGRQGMYTSDRHMNILLIQGGTAVFTSAASVILSSKCKPTAMRIRFKYFLNPERIQYVICIGADLFDMLPEYTFQEIIAKLGPIPSVAG
jgi:hypothetical protein